MKPHYNTYNNTVVYIEYGAPALTMLFAVAHLLLTYGREALGELFPDSVV